MISFRKYIFLLFFMFVSFSVYAEGWSEALASETMILAKDDNTMQIEIQVNGTTLFQMDNVPTSGYLEVYSILGVKVTSFSLKSAASVGSCYFDLPKGIYIFRAGKVAKKVIVR